MKIPAWAPGRGWIKRKNQMSSFNRLTVMPGTVKRVPSGLLRMGIHQFYYGMAADITGAASHKNIHLFIPPD